MEKVERFDAEGAGVLGRAGSANGRVGYQADIRFPVAVVACGKVRKLSQEKRWRGTFGQEGCATVFELEGLVQSRAGPVYATAHR